MASLDLFRDEGVLERIGRLEAQLRSGLEPLRRLPHVGDVRVIGGVGAVELATDADTAEHGADGGYFDRIGPRLSDAFLRRGLLLRPLGNVLYFMPPYVISDTEAAWALDTIATVLGNLDEL